MFGGGGGLNPRKMQKMMEQMGIEMDELDAEEVVISLSSGDQLVFDDADVTKMEARGQETYQIVGDPETVSGGAEQTEDDGAATTDAGGDGDIPEEDIDLVVQRTGADPEAAREALEWANGDLAAAIGQLE